MSNKKHIQRYIRNIAKNDAMNSYLNKSARLSHWQISDAELNTLSATFNSKRDIVADSYGRTHDSTVKVNGSNTSELIAYTNGKIRKTRHIQKIDPINKNWRSPLDANFVGQETLNTPIGKRQFVKTIDLAKARNEHSAVSRITDAQWEKWSAHKKNKK